MRTIIAAMQISVDGKFEGPDGYADWVKDWSDTFALAGEIDACVLGAGMYAGYEQYWTVVSEHASAALELTGRPPTQGEIDYARFARQTPHYVLSSKRTGFAWSNASPLHSLDELRTLRGQKGKGIYVVGGGQTIDSLLSNGLIDEFRFTMHPLIAGQGRSLFEGLLDRHRLDLLGAEALTGGRVGLRYKVCT